MYSNYHLDNAQLAHTREAIPCTPVCLHEEIRKVISTGIPVEKLSFNPKSKLQTIFQKLEVMGTPSPSSNESSCDEMKLAVKRAFLVIM